MSKPKSKSRSRPEDPRPLPSTKKSAERKEDELLSSDYDEIDRFHAKKDRVLLDSDAGETSDDAELYPETLLDIPSDSDQASGDNWQEEDKEFFGQGPEGDADDQDQDHDWGKGRKSYYVESASDDDLEEEAAEAERLYKKKLSALRPEDYGMGGPGVTASASDKVVVKSVVFTSEDDDDDAGAAAPSTLDPDTQGIETELQAALKQVREVLKPLLDKVSSGELKRSEGLSFLQVKYNLLLHYCINAIYYVKAKAQGKPLADDSPVLEKLIKYRMLIEKMKPLEAKLKYQIDRLLRASTEPEHTAQANEEETARPHLDMAVPSDADSGPEATAKGSGYKAPKVSFAEMNVDSKPRKQQSRIQSDLAHELKQLQDENLPEHDDIDPVRTGRKLKRAIEFDDAEEDNFVRFQLSKKDKRRLDEQSKLVDGLDDLNDMFDELESTRRRPRKPAHDDMDDAPSKAKPGASKRQRQDVRESESEIESDDAEAYYNQAKRDKQARKAARQEAFLSSNKREVRFVDPVDRDPSAPRPASRSILKNRGLTPHRSKDAKNPRVKQRKRYEKATKRLGSFKPLVKERDRPYGGEATGIRTNISKSIKF